MKWLSPLTLVFVACLFTTPLQAGDWPQFRYDAGRTAASPHELTAELHLRWTRRLPPPRPAFPHEVRLAYDASYEPVVARGRGRVFRNSFFAGKPFPMS